MPSSKISKSLLLFFFWFNLAFSQNYPVKNYNATNDLPNNTVRSLLVDSNNILWIGTDNGVVKRENDIFRYFFEEDGLAMNSCWAIAEDKNQNLWFGSYGGGVSIYDGYRFKVISEKDGLAHNEITKLFSFQNYIFVGTSDGVSLINIKNFEVISPKLPSANELFRVRDFFEYEKEVYVVTYRTGIFKIQYKQNKAALLKVNDDEYLYSVWVDKDSIYSSNKGFYTKSRLPDYLSKKDSLSSKKHGKSIIWDYVKTTNDQIFAAAWGIYDSSGGIYQIGESNQMVSKAEEFNISSKEVISLAYDPAFEKLFAGTRDSGLYEVALNPQIKFHEVAAKSILGFAETEKSSAVLLNDGIFIRGLKKEHMINLSQLKKWQENYVSNIHLPLPKHEDDFYELDYDTKAENISFYDLKANQDVYWINTNIGIFAINTSGELHRYLPLHSEEINFTQEGRLIETNPYGGVRIFRDLVSFDYNYFDQKDPHTPKMVVGSLKTERKTYFLSVFSGLYVWENNKFRSYLEEGVWKEKKLRHITAFGDNLAISTEFGDVYIVEDDPLFKILKKIPRAQIQGNSIAFLKEHQGTLIIGTEKGLTFFKNDRSIFIDEEQGLEQPIWSATVKKGTLFIGSNNGFYMVDLDAVTKEKKLVNEIRLQEIVINNEFSLDSISRKEQVNLEHNENTVLLKFSTNAHPYPNKLQYQYRLNANESWSLPTSKPEIFLPSLPPNNYRVEVRVSDQSTGLSDSQTLLTLAILPPFWQTWWFALLFMSLFILIVLGIYRFQIMQTRKFEAQKGLIQRRFEETKMEALLAQMNPHFIFNAMNSIQYYIMDSEIDKATVFLGDFAKLIRLNLDHCTKPTIVLSEEIEYLQSYVRIENTRLNNRVKVTFETDPEIDLYEVEIPTMILQTFVENVFVHAFPAGLKQPTLKISFKLLSGGVLQCKIEDNGIGFSKPSARKLHESKGVNLVKERLALLGYNIEEALQMTSVPNRGTTVILKLQV